MNCTITNIRVCTTGRHTNRCTYWSHTNMLKRGESWITRTFAVGNLRYRIWGRQEQSPVHKSLCPARPLKYGQLNAVCSVNDKRMYFTLNFNVCSLARTLYHENSRTHDNKTCKLSTITDALMTGCVAHVLQVKLETVCKITIGMTANQSQSKSLCN